MGLLVSVAVIAACASTEQRVTGDVARIAAPAPAVMDASALAMRPLEANAPLMPLPAPGPPVIQGDENTAPVVTVDRPSWVKNDLAARLYAGSASDAQIFTDLPPGSFLRVQGPARDGRLPVYYVGDGLLRRPGAAWIEEALVRAVDAPAPGQVPQIDEFAARPLPVWVQAHRATTLWSGPDTKAVAFTDLPQWTFLRVSGLERDGRLLVEYAGDFATRQAGIGWVDQASVGPAGEPGAWVQNHRASALWSGPDEQAQRFTDLPQWTKLRLVDGAPAAPGRVLVEYYGDGSTRLPGRAWVARGDIGPVAPPLPVPPVLKIAPLGLAATGPIVPDKSRQIQTRTFSSERDFIEAIGEAARRSQARTRVPASVSIAQAILESDWGRSRLTRQGNNLFGIKALGGSSGPAGTITMSTWEVENGEDIVVQAPFKAYYTLDQSVDDHGNFFIRNRRYAGALAQAADPQAFARAIQDAGYATDPSYADKLIRLMDRYDLYRFDAAG